HTPPPTHTHTHPPTHIPTHRPTIKHIELCSAQEQTHTHTHVPTHRPTIKHIELCSAQEHTHTHTHTHTPPHTHTHKLPYKHTHPHPLPLSSQGIVTGQWSVFIPLTNHACPVRSLSSPPFSPPLLSSVLFVFSSCSILFPERSFYPPLWVVCAHAHTHTHTLTPTHQPACLAPCCCC